MRKVERRHLKLHLKLQNNLQQLNQHRHNRFPRIKTITIQALGNSKSHRLMNPRIIKQSRINQLEIKF